MMIKRIGKFHKVSFERFSKDWQEVFGPGERRALQEIYNGVKLPARATAGSAGYDFYTPAPFFLKPGESIKMPTGIRVEMEEGWVLQIFPRSGLGFKYRLQLDNTVGVIDSDYFYSDNEGHMFIKVTNDSREEKSVSLPEGAAFAQGIFLPFGITEDDNCEGQRNGGFGSTDVR